MDKGGGYYVVLSLNKLPVSQVIYLRAPQNKLRATVNFATRPKTNLIFLHSRFLQNKNNLIVKFNAL